MSSQNANMNATIRRVIDNIAMLREACRFRHLRYLVIGYLQVEFGFSFEDSTRAVDIEMGYHANYGILRS